MDRETREFLERIQEGLIGFRDEMHDFRRETSERFNSLEERVGSLERKPANALIP